MRLTENASTPTPAFLERRILVDARGMHVGGCVRRPSFSCNRGVIERSISPARSPTAGPRPIVAREKGSLAHLPLLRRLEHFGPARINYRRSSRRSQVLYVDLIATLPHRDSLSPSLSRVPSRAHSPRTPPSRSHAVQSLCYCAAFNRSVRCLATSHAMIQIKMASTQGVQRGRKVGEAYGEDKLTFRVSCEIPVNSENILYVCKSKLPLFSLHLGIN